MNDKPQINRSAQPLAAAAAHLRNNPTALCLIADSGEAAQLKRMLAADNHSPLLPPILSFAQLTAAAEAAATNTDTPAQIISIARLCPPPHNKTQLTMDIYALLRQGLYKKRNAEVLSFAKSLATLFLEFVQNYPTLIIPDNAMPTLLKNMEGDYRYEAEVMAALWRFLYDGRLFAARRSGGLADFAQKAPPLIFVDAERRRPLWCDDFLHCCANGCVVFEADDLDEETLWQNILTGNDADSLPKNMQQCRQGSASALHQTAKIALTAVRHFAAGDDKKRVGIVIYDRLLARRLRAVAEADGVLIQDDGGWRMETLSFGGALRQWAHTVAEDFSAENFAHLLAAPYWHTTADKRTAAEESWRNLLAGGDALPQSWKDFNRFDKHHFAILGGFLQTARNAMPDAAPLSAWVSWLLKQSAAALAIWQNDPTAVRLRAAMQQAAKEEYQMTAAEFCAWLDMFMNDQTGGGEAIESNICFVAPTTTARFDALVLLGADADNLPATADSFFGEKGRQRLTLPGRSEHIKRQFIQFWRLATAHTKIAAVWREADKSNTLPSPFWTLLTDMWRARGNEVDTIIAPQTPPGNEAIDTLPPPPLLAQPTLTKFPPKISITAATHLMQCPYHFYMKDILSLRENDGTEEIGHKALGKLLHRMMKEFINTAGDDKDEEQLLLHWQKVFGDFFASRRGARFAREHWRQGGDSFAAEESAHRQAGWRPKLLEHSLSGELQVGGQTITLHGRLDRADCKDGGGDKNDGDNQLKNNDGAKQSGDSWAIIDYKSGGGPSKTDLQNGEDPQLPLYAFLLEQAAATWRIAYPIKKTPPTQVEDGDTEEIVTHLRTVLSEIAAGAPMPANGAPTICRRCESRRLCRRDHRQAS